MFGMTQLHMNRDLGGEPGWCTLRGRHLNLEVGFSATEGRCAQKTDELADAP
jgi:hypothetical protein